MQKKCSRIEQLSNSSCLLSLGRLVRCSPSRLPLRKRAELPRIDLLTQVLGANMHVQVNEVVIGDKLMNGLVKLLPDVPVEIALSSTDGINVVSPRGTPAVRYTLVDGRTFFATKYVAAKFKKLKI